MNLVFDFDSTIIQAESLDILAEICNCSSEVREEISNITNLGMQGEISMQDSLSRRIRLLNASIHDMPSLVARLIQAISPSFDALKDFINTRNDNCYVISGGFMEYISPICKKIGFQESHIIANQFVVEGERIIDFRKDLAISENLGKVKALRNLSLQSPICMIGDGYTDFETKKEGVVDYFVAFTESVYRKNIVDKADVVCNNFFEVIDFVNEKQNPL